MWIGSTRRCRKLLPGQPPPKLKKGLFNVERFVVLLTENSKESKWVPWELGFADAKKDNDKIAVFPVKRYSYTSDSDFTGLEYMHLYRRIMLGEIISTGDPAPIVLPPYIDRGVTLKGWLD